MTTTPLPSPRPSIWLAGALLVAAPHAQGPTAAGDLYVTEEASGEVHQHNGVNGTALGVFGTIPAPRQAMAIHSGLTAGEVLVGSIGGGVHELHRDTGALIRTYNPGGGWQWAGIYSPNGDVLIGSMSTNDVRRYRRSDGALLGVFGTVPGPADMLWGPNGNLFVCSYTAGGVYELHGTTGTLVAWRVPTLPRANDIAFLPDGRRIVTSMGTNLAHVFDAAWLPVATFAGTGWRRPHGIDISPHDGHIYVVDGVTSCVHSFHSTTYVELNATFVTVDSKPVDLEFRRTHIAGGRFTRYGNPCQGVTIGNVGVPVIGSSFAVTLQGASPGRPALLLLGASRTTWNGLPLPFPLAVVGAPGCELLAAGDVTIVVATGGAGEAQVTLTVPPVQDLVGAELFGQWAVRAAGSNALGLLFSDGAAMTIGR